MDNDLVPVRLPSGEKAYLILPRPFSIRDAEHLEKWLYSYVEEMQKTGDKEGE